MKKIYSLSFKIPIIISAIIFVTISLLASISIWSSSRAIRKAALEGFFSTVSGYSHMIDMVLHEQLLAIGTYSQSGVVLNSVIRSDDEVSKNVAIKRLKDFGNVNNHIINIGVADIDGNIILDAYNNELEGNSIASVHPELFARIKANNYDYTYDNGISISSTTGGNALLLCGGLKNDT
nr:hypothetical protein [Brachyspira sp.]